MVRYDYRQRFANASVALQALQQLLGKDIPGANFQSHPMPPADTAFLPTVPPGSVAPTPQPVTPGVSGPTGSTQLSNSLKKSLEQLLSGVIGPISSVILKRAMEQSANGQALIDQLALQLPERERSRFREEAHKLLQKYGEPSTDSTRGQPIGTTAVPTQEPIPGLEPTFIKQCEQELAQYIGPIAPLMVQRTLSQHSQLSPTQLIDLLVQHVPNPNHREAFRRKLLAST
jgi:hypothetical protein